MIFPWLTWFLLLCGFSACYATIVPAETRIRYQLSSRRRSVAAIALVAYSIPITAMIQWFVAAPQVFIAGQLAGASLSACGHVLVLWAMKSNPWFSAAIEPPPKIIMGGAYRWLMHPAYCGWAMSATGTVLLLHSSWALIPLAVYGAILLYRRHAENKLLTTIINAELSAREE